MQILIHAAFINVKTEYTELHRRANSKRMLQ